MDANKAIEAAEDDLKQFMKTGMIELVKMYRRDFKGKLRGLVSLLSQLEPVVIGLKTMIAMCNLSVSIREVTAFQETLKGLITVCESLSKQPSSSGKANLSDQLDKVERSLQEQLGILQGKKPPPPERTDVLGKIATIALHYTDPTPEESGAKAIVKGWFRVGTEVVHRRINTNPPEVPKPGSKELFETLCSRVEALMLSKEDRFYINLDCVRSRLDELRRKHLIHYIEVIEGKTVELHFWIDEVEDLKRELSKGLTVCPVDFFKVYDPSKIHHDLHELDKSLQKQVDILKKKIITH